MNLLLFIGIILMPTTALLKTQDWVDFNSSLLIEVTRPNGVFTCTGVAVSPELIVTAAHCLDGEVKSVRVFTQNYYDPKNPSLAIKRFKIHSGYQPKKSRYICDIAKIQMKEKLPSDVIIRPIHKGSDPIGDLYRFGFGARNKKNLRTAITPKFKFVNYQDRVLELYDQYSYSGDSGGPVFQKYGEDISIMAIHSTLSFGPEGKYSYNPLLESFYDWIFEN